MTVTPVDLTLASATLSGGARLASAGGGLPQRLTTELDGFVDLNALGVGAQVQGVLFASDNSGDVITCTGSSVVKRFAGSGTTWSQTYSTSASICRNLARSTITAGKMWMARQTAGINIWELDEATGVVTSRATPSMTSVQVFGVPGGTANAVWLHNGSSPLTEVDITTGLATGRTFSPTGCLVAAGSNWDGTPSIYVLETTIKITRWNESTLTLMDTWATVPGGDIGPPCCDFGRSGIIVQADGRLIVRGDSPYAIDRLPAVGGTDMHSNAGAERLVWSSSEVGGLIRSNLSGGAQYIPGMDISLNGRWLCWITSSAGSVAQRGVSVRNIQDQTVEWTIALTGQTALDGVSMPGAGGNHYGRFPLLFNGHSGAIADYRNTRYYYQRVGIDGAPVFLDGAFVPPGGLSLVGASALKIGAVFNRGLGKLTSAEGPYIGGPSGEGPRIYLESGVTPHRNRLHGSL